MKRVLAILSTTVLLYSCAGDTEPATDTVDSVVTAPAAVAVMTSDGQPVPESVNNMFKSAYPDVVGATWAWEDSMYVATFNNSGLDMEVKYLPDGKRQALVAAITPDNLPAPVFKSAKTLGPITAAKKLTMADGSTRYEVIVKDEDYFYDENGGMIQEGEAKEDVKRLMKKDN